MAYFLSLIGFADPVSCITPLQSRFKIVRLFVVRQLVEAGTWRYNKSVKRVIFFFFLFLFD